MFFVSHWFCIYYIAKLSERYVYERIHICVCVCMLCMYGSKTWLCRHPFLLTSGNNTIMSLLACLLHCSMWPTATSGHTQDVHGSWRILIHQLSSWPLVAAVHGLASWPLMWHSAHFLSVVCSCLAQAQASSLWKMSSLDSLWIWVGYYHQFLLLLE